VKALIQRARDASVVVGGQIVGTIDRGLVVLVGVAHADTIDAATILAKKVAALRVFDDADGVPNLSLVDTGFSALVVSQFTLVADTRKGNRPSYSDAARPEHALAVYEFFVKEMKKVLGADRVATGLFGAMMDVALVNEGPFTLMIETK
jgi:D-tyrosyl-tRNA(Tyr) deacylase